MKNIDRTKEFVRKTSFILNYHAVNSHLGGEDKEEKLGSKDSYGIVAQIMPYPGNYRSRMTLTWCEGGRLELI